MHDCTRDRNSRQRTTTKKQAYPQRGRLLRMPFSVVTGLELEDDAVLLRGPSAPAAEEQD